MAEDGNIPNPVRPIFSVELDHTRHLKFGTNSIIALEKVTGENLRKSEGWNRVFGDMSMTAIIQLLWGALVWEDKKLTVDDVGDMFDNLGASEQKAVGEALNKAIEAHVLRREGDDQRPLVPAVEVPAETAT